MSDLVRIAKRIQLNVEDPANLGAPDKPMKSFQHILHQYGEALKQYDDIRRELFGLGDKDELQCDWYGPASTTRIKKGHGTIDRQADDIAWKRFLKNIHKPTSKTRHLVTGVVRPWMIIQRPAILSHTYTKNPQLWTIFGQLNTTGSISLPWK